MYESVFEENKKQKMNEALVFSISTVEDAYEAMQKCVSLVIEKKRGGLVVVIGRIAEAVMNGIKDALSNLDPNKAETLKRQIVTKFITLFKKDAVSAPEEPMM